MSTKGKSSLGLFEFLEEAELQQYYNSFKNILQVQNVQQLKYVVEDDLFNIGMSKPEARRLRTYFYKACPQNYASKLKKFLRPRKDDGKHELLLGEEDHQFAFKDRRHSIALGGTNRQGSSTVRVPSQHVIPAEAIAVHKELGAGEFGVVQQGVWTDEDQMRHQVAVKCLSKEKMQNNTLAFMKEYEIMQAIDHPHVVRLYGVVLDAAQIMLITELASLRSLLECLKEPALRSTFTVPCLTSFAQQICEGMQYLEAKRLIHRDLAARNILVFSKNVVKVSDFGLSRALGVGKDYYQTNFNVNLKLPIAWCAPECINFLKFTSASDVWAFGVTMWEMFSYGFQPWAALTGQQILEAIDEPNCHRLEPPVHCPREHYLIMLQCWKHEVHERPTFEKLCSILEEAKPEQVQAVTSSGQEAGKRDILDFEVGDVITVLDKNESNGSNSFWTGALNNGKVGYFSPAHTVTYIGTLPSQGNHSKWQHEDIYQSTSGTFQRNSLRGSRGSKKKISREMISGPRGEVQHTGHIGLDGAFFGDVGAFATATATSTATESSSRGGTMTKSWHPSMGKSMTSGFPVLSRADSDASERAPLIAGRGGSTSSAGGNSTNGQSEGQPHCVTSYSTASEAVGTNKNPRMGYAIGYLRKSSNASQNNDVPDNGGQPYKPHEYHTISDDELGGPLDLGPSLMDEVFSELDSSKDSKEEPAKQTKESSESRSTSKERKSHLTKHNMKEMKELVSSTLTLHKKHKKKQQATVKPIKASDEKTLENAIAMANALASKSMHDLDKRCIDSFYDNSPIRSPLTPNSPSKKFQFWFPGKSSPKGERRHFSEELQSSADVESMITPSAKDAYRALIEGGSSRTSLDDEPHSPRSPPSPVHQAQHAANSFTFGTKGRSLSDTNGNTSNATPSTTKNSCNNNPLPLPPKTTTLDLSAPPKRHVRKNPLIIPSGMAANILRRESTANENIDLQMNNHNQPSTSDMDPNSNYSGHSLTHLTSVPLRQHTTTISTANSSAKTTRASSTYFHRKASLPAYSAFSHASSSQVSSVPDDNHSLSRRANTQYPTLPSTNPTSLRSSRNFEEYEDQISSDAFENAIACSMDALDNIPDTIIDSSHSPRPGASSQVHYYNQDHVSCEDLLDFRPNIRRTRGKARGLHSDEVRIMKKVLGTDISDEDCVQSLDSTDWDVHHAIKLVKLKNLIKFPEVSDEDMKIALQTRDWDVAKAANVLMKKLKE